MGSSNPSPDQEVPLKDIERIIKPVIRKVLNGTRVFDVDAAVDDVSQRVMVETWRGGRKVEERKLRRLAEHRAIDYLRSMDREAGSRSLDAMLEDGMEPDWGDSETVGPSDPRYEKIREAMRGLSQPLYDAMYLFYIEGHFEGEPLTLEDVAARLSVPVGTVKRRLHDARTLLRNSLQDRTFSETPNA